MKPLEDGTNNNSGVNTSAKDQAQNSASPQTGVTDHAAVYAAGIVLALAAVISVSAAMRRARG